MYTGFFVIDLRGRISLYHVLVVPIICKPRLSDFRIGRDILLQWYARLASSFWIILTHLALTFIV